MGNTNKNGRDVGIKQYLRIIQTKKKYIHGNCGCADGRLQSFASKCTANRLSCSTSVSIFTVGIDSWCCCIEPLVVITSYSSRISNMHEHSVENISSKIISITTMAALSGSVTLSYANIWKTIINSLNLILSCDEKSSNFSVKTHTHFLKSPFVSK